MVWGDSFLMMSINVRPLYMKIRLFSLHSPYFGLTYSICYNYCLRRFIQSQDDAFSIPNNTCEKFMWQSQMAYDRAIKFMNNCFKPLFFVMWYFRHPQSKILKTSFVLLNITLSFFFNFTLHFIVQSNEKCKFVYIDEIGRWIWGWHLI